MKRYGKIIKYIFSLILIVTIMGDSFAIYAKESSGAAGIADVLQKADDISETELEMIKLRKNNEALEAYYYANEPVEVFYWGYKELGVSAAEENVNIYENMDTDSKQMGQLPKGAGCEIIEVADGWYYIESGKVRGFVQAGSILTGEEAIQKAEEYEILTATVTADNLKVRTQTNTKCKTRGMIKKNTVWNVLEDLGDWIKIQYDGDKESYVSAEYVSVSYTLDTALTMTEVKYGRGVTDVGIAIAEYAVQFVGNPYVWGGTSLTKGADCSGFTMTIFKKYGVKLTHSARAQAKKGVDVPISDLRPGDLVFYSDSSGINHVTIYIGDGKVVHASSPKNGIKISKLNYRTPTCARRLIEE